VPVDLFLKNVASLYSGTMKTSVLICIIATAAALKYLPEHAREGSVARDHPELLPPVASGRSVTNTLDMPLDHFSDTGKTYKNYYYTDDTYWDKENGPLFVEMGGEGGVGGAHAGAQHKKHKALAISVEHRFYGKSIPNKDRTVANLQYLSVEQNLADTAAIVEAVQKTLKKKRAVISFGGSYSGATSAWFRMTYPNVTDGSISSSGVVNAILNYTQFDDQVAKAIELPTPGCGAALKAHVAAMEGLFKSGKTDHVKTVMGAKNLVGTKMGDPDFWYMVADGAAMADQYGQKKKLCEAMTKVPATSDPEVLIKNYAAFLAEVWGKEFGTKCFYDSECLKTEGTPALGMDRSWRWEKCNQLAYLQPAYPGDPVRSEMLTLEDEIAQCKYVFGDDAIATDLNTGKFNAKYGGAEPGSGTLKASKIYFLDFSDDPWNRASVSKQLSPDLPYCMTTCDGCGHCGSGVPATLTKCFDEEDKHVEEWLAEAEAELGY
jgi:hypothetical protein